MATKTSLNTLSGPHRSLIYMMNRYEKWHIKMALFTSHQYCLKPTFLYIKKNWDLAIAYLKSLIQDALNKQVTRHIYTGILKYVVHING